jgi:hypothetical protein
MAESKSVYRDADGVRRTIITDDERPNGFVVNTQQYLDEILDSVKRDRETMSHGVNKLLARLPVTVYERACHEHWGEDDWRKYLNSSEAAPFRIWQGKV